MNQFPRQLCKEFQRELTQFLNEHKPLNCDPETMSTDGPDQSKGDLPWENLDATPDDLVVVSEETANKDESSTISEASDEKVCISVLLIIVIPSGY